MLVIRPEQMEVLNVAADRVFRGRLIAFLRENMGAWVEGMNDISLDEFISKCMGIARCNGIESDAGIAQYVCLALDSAPEFIEQPEIRSFLHEPGSQVEDQLSRLVNILAEDPDEWLE